MGILVYHMVDDRFSLGVTRIAPRCFQNQVLHLLQHGFRFLTISDYLASPAEKSVALTFDDGYASVFEHAFPVLRSMNMPATVFVNPGYIGQWNTWDVNLAWRRFRLMDWRQIEELRQAGWEIGIHGLRHKDLSRLSSAQLDEEIGLSQRLLQKRLGDCSRVISYPFGNTSAKVVDCCRRHGLAAGVTMSGKPKALQPQFAIQRLGVYPFDGFGTIRRKAQGKGLCAVCIQRTMDVCSDATVLVKYQNWNLD